MKGHKIYIAGHTGLIGSAILRRFQREGFADIITRTHKELDLTRQADVEDFFIQERPELTILAAGRVGGIHANMSYPAQFLFDNLSMQLNVINSAFLSGVKKLLFLGSACTYPRSCPQPIKEEYLLSGSFEPTNEAYAVAKLAGIKMCQAYNKQYGTNFICAIPTNTYGPGDSFDNIDSHVIPALIRKFHDAKINKAKTISLWGTGSARRDFIYSDDIAGSCFFLMRHYNSSEIINVGTGKGISIKGLADCVKEVVGFKGEIIFDASKPDGMPLKLLDISRINSLGWQAKTPLVNGIRQTYRWYLDNIEAIDREK